MKKQTNKIEVSVNQYAIDREINAVEVAVKQLQAVRDEISRITGKEISLPEIVLLLASGIYQTSVIVLSEAAFMDYYIQCVAPGNKLNSVPMDRGALLNMIQKPDLSTLAHLVKGLPGAVESYVTIGLIVESKQGVTVADGAVSAIRERYTTYAETEAEIQRYSAAKELADSLNKLCELIPENPLYRHKVDISGEISSILSVDDSGRYIPADRFVISGTVAEGVKAITNYKAQQPEPRQELSDAYIRSLML